MASAINFNFAASVLQEKCSYEIKTTNKATHALYF